MSVRAITGVLAAALILPVATAVLAAPDAAPAKPALAGAKARGVHVLQAGETAKGEERTLVSNTAPPAPAPVNPPHSFVVTPVTHSVMKPCDRPFAKPDMILGAARFDRDLNGALKAGRTVVVDLAQPYDQASAPPSPLSPWLSAAKAGGGSVKVTPYCVGGRGVFRDWVADVVAHLTGSLYRPARDYDVTLFADATRRQVTQVQFKPKSAALAAN